MKREYLERNVKLAGMGYKSYRAYLASPLWADIRARVMEKYHGLCLCCRQPATEAHHRKYTVENLSGHSIDGIVAVCRTCHKSVEFSSAGKKTTATRADRRLKRKLTLRQRANRAKNESKAQLPNG